MSGILTALLNLITLTIERDLNIYGPSALKVTAMPGREEITLPGIAVT